MVSSANPLQIDRDELQRAVNLLMRPGETYEVRTLGNGPVRSGYFADHEALIEEVSRIQAAMPCGIYFGLNPPKQETMKGRTLNRI
jgi:hypothetical protein